MDSRKLIIEHDKIKIESRYETGYSDQLSFDLSIKNIQIVAFTTKVVFDDNEIYITFIDENGKVYHINSYFFTQDFRLLLKEEFGYVYYANNIPDEHFEKGKSKIVYPKNLLGKDLYKSNGSSLKTLWDNFLRSIKIRQPAGGILTDEVQKYICSLTLNS